MNGKFMTTNASRRGLSGLARGLTGLHANLQPSKTTTADLRTKTHFVQKMATLATVAS